MTDTAPNLEAESTPSLELTLDKDLGPILTTVLGQLDTYAKKSPTTLALETEQTGLKRRVVQNTDVVNRVRSLQESRKTHSAATVELASADTEIAQLDAQLRTAETTKQDDAQKQLLRDRLTDARNRRSKALTAQAKAVADHADALNVDLVGDQEILDLWKSGPANSSIDGSAESDEAMNRILIRANGTIKDLTERGMAIDSELADEAKQASAKRSAIKSALDAVRKAVTDQPGLRETKTKLDTEAAEAAAKASAAASTLDADIKSAQDAVIKRHGGKGKPSQGANQAEVRRLANRLTAAETKLTANAVSLGNKAEKAAKAAVKANPDLILVDKLDSLRKVLPKDAYDYDMVDALCTNARLAAMEKSTNKVLGGLAADHKDLATPGSKIERGINIEAGAAIEAALVVRVRLTGLYGLKVAIEHTSDGKFKASYSNSIGAKLGGKLGFDSDQTKGVAIGSLQGDLFGGKERTYESLEDLLTAERGIILDAVLSAPTAKGKARKEDRTFLKKREQLIAQTHVKNAALQKRLRHLGVQGTLTEYSPKHVGVATTKIRGRQGGFAGKAAFQVVDPMEGNAGGLGVSVGASVTNGVVSKQQYKKFSFIEDLEASGALQELHMLKADKGLSVAVFRDVMTEVEDNDGNVSKKLVRTRQAMGHDETVQYLRKLEGTITNLTTARAASGVANAPNKNDPLLHVAKELHGDLVELRAELDSITSLSQDLSKANPNSEREVMRKRMLKARGFGPNDTAAYIHSLSLQFTVLNRLCSQANEPFTGTDFDVLGADGKRNLEKLRADLQTPRIKLSDKDVAKIYGNDAYADGETIHQTNFSLNAAIQGTVGFKNNPETSDPDDASEKNTKTKQQKTRVPSMNLTFSYTKEDKYKKGDKKPDTSISIVLDGNFSFSGAWGENEDMGTKNDKTDDLNRLSTLVAKLVDVRSLKKLSVDAGPDVESELTDALKATLRRGNGTAKIDFKVVDGQLRLKKVAAVQETARNVGGGVSVTTGTFVNVVGSVNLSQKKTQVLSVYHGSNTLSELTDLYRTKAEDTSGGGARWANFRKDSRLLARMTAQMVRAVGTAGGKDAKGRSIKNERTFEGILQDIRDGKQMKQADLVTGYGMMTKNTAGVANEMVGWLIDLKTSSDAADRDAADKFIDIFKEKQGSVLLKKRGSVEYEAAMTEIENSFETVLKRKTKKDDAEADDDYVKKHGLSRKDINTYVTEKLSAHTNALVKRLGAAEHDQTDNATELLPQDLGQLRGRALRLYKANKTKANRQLVEDVMALDYAAKTLDDLTKFDDEKDKNEAIGMLGTDLDSLLKKPKIYVNAWIEAEFEASPQGDLVLVPVVKKGKAAVVKKTMLDREASNTLKRINADAGGDVVTRGQKVKMISDQHGNPTIEWKDQYYVSAAREKELAKQGVKMGGIYTKKAAKKSLRSHGGKSISAQLEKVMKAQAQKAERRRRAEQQRKRAAQTAAANH